MTRKEAAIRLSLHLLQCSMLMPIEWIEENSNGSEFMKAFRMALDALNATPAAEGQSCCEQQKAVIVETETDREFVDYICPRCKMTISQKRKGQKYGLYQPKYHDECGQWLSWPTPEVTVRGGLK